VNALCQMTGVSRSGYYRWRVPRPSFPVEMELRDAMQKVALEFPVLRIPPDHSRAESPRLRRQSQAGAAADARR